MNPAWIAIVLAAAEVNAYHALLSQLICHEKVRRARYRNDEVVREEGSESDLMFQAERGQPLGLAPIRLKPNSRSNAPSDAAPPFFEAALWRAVVEMPLSSTLHFEETAADASGETTLIKWVSSAPTVDLTRVESWSGHVVLSASRQPLHVELAPNLQAATIAARRRYYVKAPRLALWIFGFHAADWSSAELPLEHMLSIEFANENEGWRLPSRAELTSVLVSGPRPSDRDKYEVTVVEYSNCRRFGTDTEQEFQGEVK